MRLIDADAFKEKYGDYYAEEEPTEGFIGTVGQLIDTAPTIGVEPDCTLKQFGKCNYNESGCSDCFIKERIRRALDEKAYEIGHADGARLGYEKGLKDARPKGKWIFNENMYHQYCCSECGLPMPVVNDYYRAKIIGCPYCLADMRVDV